MLILKAAWNVSVGAALAFTYFTYCPTWWWAIFCVLTWMTLFVPVDDGFSS